jgi:alanine racemase
MQLNMVRAGILLYGLAPAPGVPGDGFIPVMTLKTVVEQVKEVPAGCGVSYGRTFITRRPTRLATLPIGYGDGYLRAYSGASMTVRGRKAPVVGRVCMDMCLLDVTDIPDVREGDPVTVFGPAPDTTADELAAKTNTINYEVVTTITKRVVRLYFKGGVLCDRLACV